MAIPKAERLTNLVIGLLSTTQYITAEQIRRDFAGYDECRSRDAFNRMFERDKAELRDLGIPVSTGRASAFADDVGYRIDRAEYELPPVDFTPEESAAVAIAGQYWQSPEMTAAAESAIVKLRAAGVPVDDTGVATVVGGMGCPPAGEPALAGLVAAIDAGRAVRFDHLAAGTGVTSQRTVQPWAVTTAKGRWYLVGHDLDRDAPRTFRLSRITGPVTAFGPDGAVRVPDDAEPHALVREAAAEPTEPGTAQVWLAAGRAHGLRRTAVELHPRRLGGRDGAEARIPIGARSSTVRIIAGHGEDAIVLEPEDLRSEVCDVLLTAAGTHGDGDRSGAGVDGAPGHALSRGTRAGPSTRKDEPADRQRRAHAEGEGDGA